MLYVSQLSFLKSLAIPKPPRWKPTWRACTEKQVPEAPGCCRVFTGVDQGASLFRHKAHPARVCHPNTQTPAPPSGSPAAQGSPAPKGSPLQGRRSRWRPRMLLKGSCFQRAKKIWERCSQESQGEQQREELRLGPVPLMKRGFGTLL